MPPQEILGIRIPDSTIARAATELVRDTESELLFLHSMRVYGWGALAGRRKGLAFDPELLYVGAMFHDLGLAERFRESTLRFEVDGANAAREFLRGHGIPEQDIDEVWSAIAFHTCAASSCTRRGRIEARRSVAPARQTRSTQQCRTSATHGYRR